jgi:hypothetical protein
LDTVIMGNLWSWSYGNWELFDFCSLWWVPSPIVCDNVCHRHRDR